MPGGDYTGNLNVIVENVTINDKTPVPNVVGLGQLLAHAARSSSSGTSRVRTGPTRSLTTGPLAVYP